MSAYMFVELNITSLFTLQWLKTNIKFEERETCKSLIIVKNSLAANFQ